MDFRRTTFTPEALIRYEQLLRTCFPGSAKFRAAYLKWLYEDNPDGQVVGFDAWAGDDLAAHYVCVPSTAVIGDETVRVLLSLNTATHPDHQGKGMFTKLASMTYESGKEDGFDAVYGVANASSTPGFLRKLDFQLIAPLLAKVGFGGLGVDFDQVHAKSQFRRVWSQDALAWRCGNPANPIVARHRGTGTVLRTRGATGTTAWTEVGEQHNSKAGGRMMSPMRLFLGLLPAGVGGLRGYCDIPKRFRPSPLNLIYRPLAGRVDKIESGSVFLTFADFDAY